MALPQGKFIRHAPCPHCGSSDAYCLYSSGTAFCQSCKTYDAKAYAGEEKVTESKSLSLIPFGECKALTARKITKITCEAYGYFHGKYSDQTVQVAQYYKKRKLSAQHLRFRDKSFIWIGSPKGVELWGQHLYPAGGKRLIITEGEVDCLSLAQVFNLKWPVVSIPSGVNSAKQALLDNMEYVNSFEEVVLAFDNDDPGRASFSECAPLLSPGKVKAFNYQGLELKDANEFLQGGQAVLLAEGVFKALPYRPDGILSGKELESAFFEEEPDGFSTPYPMLDSLTYGVRKGELWLFTAGSGIGKSTLVHEIGCDLLVRHHQNIGVMALEESKRRLAKRYPSIYLSVPLHLPGMMSKVPKDKLQEAFDHTTGSGRFWMYDHWGSKDIDTIMSKLRYMALGCKCDFIIIDHISIVVSGLDEIAESERKMLDKFMTSLTSLISETDVGILAVVHLKRPQQGKSFGEGREPVLTDLRGSGGLEQMSFTVISLNRNQMSENSNESWIRVLKNRTIGKLGVADTLEYSEETGRLLPKGEAPMINTDF